MDTGDERISYQVSGSGPPMFCLHGWAGFERTYDPITPYFDPHFRMYQLAWPGYGSQRLRHGRYFLSDMVRWVDTTRQKLGFEQIYLMGNCIGANVALEYAYQHPDRLAFLILNEPHAFMPPYFYLIVYPIFKDVLLRLAFKTGIGVDVIMKIFPLEEGGGKGSGYTKRRLLTVPTRSMSAFLTAMYYYARSTRLYARPKVEVPTIFPLPVATFGQVAAFERTYGPCFANLEVLRIKTAVHNPVVEDPEAFSKAVLPHLI